MLEKHLEDILLDKQIGPQAVAVNVFITETKVLHKFKQSCLILDGCIGRLGCLRARRYLRGEYTPNVKARHGRQGGAPIYTRFFISPI